MVFERAVETLDHFPSLAQLKEISGAVVDHGKPLQAIYSAPDVKQFPWPMSVMGLIDGFDNSRGVSNFGLRQLKISHDEAKFLFECAKAGKWDEPWAKEIIKKSKTGEFEESLKDFGFGRKC